MNTSIGLLRFICIAAIALFIAGIVHELHAQLHPVQTINEVQEFLLPCQPTFPTLLYFSNTRIPDLLFFDKERSKLIIAAMEEGIGFVKQREIFSTLQITSLTTGNLNNDGLDDIVIVQREANKIIVLLSRNKDSSFTPFTYNVNYYPEHAVIGDLSGDNIPDIVTYGKLSSGLSFLRGRGNNKFNKAKTLFPSLPISSCSIIHLNADNIPDIVLRNWLNNEDVFYFGIGGTRFSEQTALAYGEDSTLSSFVDCNADGVADAAVVSSQFRNIQIYHSSGLANVSLEQNLSILHNATSIRAIWLEKNSLPSLLLIGATNNDFSLLVNKGNGTFYDEIVFGMPYTANYLVVGDMDGDGHSDILCFDESSGRYTIFWNARTRMQSAKTARVAVGKNPSSISAIDFNGDNIDDLLISNERSSTLSFLLGSKSGVSSQLSVETSEAPSFASLYSRNDTAVIVLTGHQKTNKIGLTTLIKEHEAPQSLTGEVESYTIPLAASPAYALPDAVPGKQSISLYVFFGAENNPIVFYQQLKGTKFIAKSLTPLIPSQIIFATISNLNRDNFSDVVYLYSDTAHASVFLGITLNDASDEFKGKTFSYAIPDSGTRRAYIYVEDFNDDQRKDYLLYVQSSRRIYLIAGKDDGDIGTSKIIAEGVSLSAYNQLQLYDINLDRRKDIIFLDTQTMSLNVIRGKGNGIFYPPQTMIQLPKEAIFSCGDFNGDGKIDIAYTQPVGHTVTIVYGE